MFDKEAAARVKINKLLEAAGWRFFAEGTRPEGDDALRYCVNMKLESFIPELVDKTYRGVLR